MATAAIPRPASASLPSFRDPALLIPVVGAGVLIYLAVLPLLMLLIGSFQAEVAPREFVYTLKNYQAAYASEYTYSTFMNSLIFASGSAGLSFIIGTLLAWLTERTNTPLRGLFVPLAVVPLILPGVLESIAWIFLLSPKFGYLNVWLMNLFGVKSPPFNVFSLPGMIWVHSVGQVPLAFLMMVAAFKSMDPSLEESAMMSGARTWQTFKRITLRLLMPTAGSVLLILFVRTLESFETPALIGIPARIYVYTSEIFLAFNEYPPDYGRGGALAVGLLLLSAIGVWLYTRATKEGKKFQTVTGKAFRPRQFDLGPWRWLGLGFLMTYFLFVVLLPFLVLFWASFLPFFAAPSLNALNKLSLDNYRYLSGFRPFWEAMKNSILLATLTATVAMVLTSLVAWIVYKSRLRGAWLLDFLAFVPITIPGIVMGMSLILLYVAFPLPIYGTIWLLLIAYVTRFIPYGMRSASGSILQIHSELEEAAAASGASWWETFKRVTLPLLRPGFAAGWIYICIVSFREFSTSVLLATGESRVLSILLFTMFEQGQVTVVAAIGVLMIATLLAIVALFYKVSGRVGIQT
ncbi:MAG TPA: iron ABC transporter permease [Candidatus Binatia bacterium]|jgi:iron(III) transport system permease protein|nr:iron ABC transporter permease [Candidatus Binatia bacterium]